MHSQLVLRFLAPFLAFLGTTAADNSAPFKLKSHVLHPPNPTLDGLYFTAFDYHPGGFFFGTIAAPSTSNPALVSFLTGTAADLANGNATLEISTPLPDATSYYFVIATGNPQTAPSVYDYVELRPDSAATFGLHFVGGVLKYSGFSGQYYACLSDGPTPQGESSEPAGVHRLYFRPVNDVTPAGCSTLQLIQEPV